MNIRLLWILPLFLLVLAFPVSADLNTDIESYYAFDEGTGSTTVDSTPNGNDGTINGASWTSSGIINNALTFDGVDDNVEIPNLGIFDSNNNFSIVLRFNTDTISDEQLLLDLRGENTIVIGQTSNSGFDKVEIRTNQGGSWDGRAITTNTISTGTDYLLIANFDSSSGWNMYLNNAEQTQLSSSTASFGTSSLTNYIGSGVASANPDGVDFFNGLIDEPAFFNNTLNSFQRSFLWNGGSPTTDQQYPFSSDEPFAHVQVLDLYDNATLSNYSSDGTVLGFEVTWPSLDQGSKSNFTDASGVAKCNNCSGNLSFVVEQVIVGGDVPVCSGGCNSSLTRSFVEGKALYFDDEDSGFYSPRVAVQNATFSSGLFGARFNFSIFDVHNNSVSSFNLTSGLQSNSTSTGFADLVLKPNSSSTVLVDSSGFISQNFSVSAGARDLSSESLFGLFNNNITINASDSLDGGAISTFCVNVTGVNITSFEDSDCTTSGNVSFGLLDEHYNFFIDASGYAFQNETVSVVNESQFFEFFLLPQNSIFLFFFDANSLASLNGTNVTVDFAGPSTSFSNSSTSGEMIASDLSVGTWNVSADAVGYDNRLYFVTITQRSSQVLDVYLTNSSESSTTTFDIRSQVNSDIIVGATLTMQHRVSGSWVTVGQCVTDAFGTCRFELLDGKEYRFVVEASGFETKTGTFVRTLSSYVISLSAETDDFQTYLDDFSFSASPAAGTLDSSSHNFSFTVSSPDGRLVWFSQRLEYGNTTLFSNVTGSPSGGTISESVDLSSFSGEVLATYHVKSTRFDDPFTFSRTWSVFSNNVTHNYTFIGFMEYYGDGGSGELSAVEQALLLTSGAVLLALGVGLVAGGVPAAIVASLVFAAGSFFGWLHWSVSIVVIFLIVGIIFSERRGGRF